ncbi:MAG: tRNA threonylcarbamoyladenosine biosynthesis protein TsaE [Mycoplasmataceae bacterium]|nr:MAG: tRNA threonylcarbamoyladenosine biosynthesis protein TsaE [Mycoplasmataceae bacterium]
MKININSLNSNEKIFHVKSIEDLKIFSKFLADKLEPDSFLLLSGDLGVGKTSLVQFISYEFGIEEKVNSPTFNILKRYWIDKKKCFLNHFDFFKLKKNEDISFFDDFKFNNINIIEWPELNSLFWNNEIKVFSVKMFFGYENERKIKYSYLENN